MPNYAEQLAEVRAASRKESKTETETEPESTEKNISNLEFAIIGIIAVTNDLCDWFGLDLFFFRIIDLCTAIILGLWCWLRLNKFPSARFGISFIIELIPFLGDFSPTWTIFVITTYAEQRGYSGPIKKLNKLVGK